MRRTILTTFVLGAMVGFLTPAAAQQEADAGPALGVARISLTNGDVSTKRGDSGDWVAATVNAPVVEGDTVATGAGSRAEIQMDYSNLVRLDAETEVVMTNLGERNFRVQLFNGRMTYSELQGGEADVDIETPHAAIRPHKNGRYEIETRPGETVIQVRKGQAEVFTSEGTETVDKGRMLVVRDTPEGIEVRLAGDEPRDDWDRWNEDRDERLSDVESYRYVSRSVVGAGDLDGYGDWRYVSGYGYCWYPRVAVGWAPYRQGRWGWAPYYGWTWIGYEPWGWAPYHYGRWWNHPSYGWGWYPGSIHYYQPWRPALVGFFGYSGRGGWSVGVGFGSVGWVPLAPGEVYHPWYGRRGYGGRNSTIIVDNSVNIYNDYRNARVNNGVTVVDAGGFSRGRLDNVRSLDRNELARASALRGDVPVVPERQAQGSILRNIRTSASNGEAGAAARRTTFSRGDVRQAVSPRQPSFEEQRQQVATSVRQIRTQDAVNSTRQSAARTTPRAGGSVRSAGDVRSSGRTEAATRSGIAPRSSPTFSAPDRRAGSSLDRRDNNVDRGASVRNSRATTSAPQRDATTRSSSRDAAQLQPRDNNIDSSGVRSGSRATTSAPARSETRSSGRGSIQRRNNSMDSGPSVRDRGSSGLQSAPSRSESRVDRSSSRAPSASGGSGARIDRGSSRVRGSDYSDSGRIPRATAPSSSDRSRAPEIRSSPSRSPRISRESSPSSPRMSRPSWSSGPSPRASSPSPRMSSPRASGGGVRGGSRGGSGGGSRGSRR